MRLVSVSKKFLFFSRSLTRHSPNTCSQFETRTSPYTVNRHNNNNNNHFSLIAEQVFFFAHAHYTTTWIKSISKGHPCVCLSDSWRKAEGKQKIQIRENFVRFGLHDFCGNNIHRHERLLLLKSFVLELLIFPLQPDANVWKSQSFWKPMNITQ